MVAERGTVRSSVHARPSALARAHDVGMAAPKGSRSWRALWSAGEEKIGKRLPLRWSTHTHTHTRSGGKRRCAASGGRRNGPKHRWTWGQSLAVSGARSTQLGRCWCVCAQHRSKSARPNLAHNGRPGPQRRPRAHGPTRPSRPDSSQLGSILCATGVEKWGSLWSTSSRIWSNRGQVWPDLDRCGTDFGRCLPASVQAYGQLKPHFDRNRPEPAELGAEFGDLRRDLERLRAAPGGGTIYVVAPEPLWSSVAQA